MEVYQTEIKRVAGFLEAEIDFVRKRLTGSENVLELGAGYGRIMKALSGSCRSITGIDIAEASVELGKEYLKDCPNCQLYCMDAFHMNLESGFDTVLCLQNGLSAIKGGETRKLMDHTMKLLKDNGTAYFSSYSPKFWAYRLEWFREQARKGLIGEIDPDRTKDGNIVCKDGFTARTIPEAEFESLGRYTGCPFEITEVDESSIFLIIIHDKVVSG